MRLELGAGNKPTDGFQHADRWKHSPHIDLAFDLEVLPWPLEDESIDHLLAIDVFEHLRPWLVTTQQWLDECHRVLRPGGILEFRLPSWTNHYSYRDPTHYRVFHEETFHYWCPNLDRDGRSTVWTEFGRYYFGEGYDKWWDFVSCVYEANDFRFTLRKPDAAAGAQRAVR